MIPERAPSNAPEWTVSDLSGALKRTLEDAFGYVRLKGEVSNYRGPHASGHAYFCLKDASARIDAVIWKTSLARLKMKPQDGLEVVASGRITTFPGKSSYQIIIDSIEPAGIGAIMALVEERRRRLAAEGLFDEARKRSLPFLPRIVGVVTSPTGAVIRDILHRLADRFPRSVLLWPVRVQGETSGEEVAAAIRGFNALDPGGPIPRPEVLIVARGGGSLEDLMGFNEEAVVRAAFESAIPLISAVGHETDWTLLDHVADRRAPTPTGAAEIAVPVRSELLAGLSDRARRLTQCAVSGLDRRRRDLRALSRALPTPEALLAAKRQRLDLAAARLAPGLRQNGRRKEQALIALGRRLAERSPSVRRAQMRARLEAIRDRPALLVGQLLDGRRRDLARLGPRLERAHGRAMARERDRLDQARRRLSSAAERLASTGSRALDRRRERLASLAQLFGSLNYKAVLARGYALVRDESGGLVRRAVEIGPGQPLGIEFADGTVRVAAGEGRVARRRSPPAAADAQASLFGDEAAS